MTPDGFETLKLIRNYLASDVVPILPDHIATEVRASLKLLDTIALEFNALPALLPADMETLDRLCRRAEALLSAQPESIGNDRSAVRVVDPQTMSAKALEISTQLALYQRTRSVSAHAVVHLQTLASEPSIPRERLEAIRDLLSDFFRVLGDQARARAPWQVVFPANAMPR